MRYLQQINEHFPIRKKDEDKQKFLKWAKDEATSLGYSAKVEENGKNGKHKNLVVGNADQAQAIFTAHYDTPANMLLPNIMMPRNLVLFFAYQLAVVLVLLVVCGLLALLVGLLGGGKEAIFLAFLLSYYGLLILMLLGPANRHNKNDNTSGVAAVLELMRNLPEDARANVAFILFDNEEKGKLGSKAFAAAHPQIKKNTLVVNMDCVGVGEHVLLIGKNYARAQGIYALLEQSLSAEEGITPHCYGASGSACNSDQNSFRCGAVLCACRRKRLVGFYTPYIHTRRDTVADDKNIAYLARSLTKFVKMLQSN